MVKYNKQSQYHFSLRDSSPGGLCPLVQIQTGCIAISLELAWVGNSAACYSKDMDPGARLHGLESWLPCATCVTVHKVVNPSVPQISH